MEFPFGKAPLVIVIASILSGVFLFVTGSSDNRGRADLVMATFTKEHAEAYRPVIAAFEKKHNVRVQIQVVSQPSLQGRLQSSMAVGADVPDMVELLDGTMGFFTQGPVEDVKFVDLTPRVEAAGLFDKLVRTRFGKWTSRGHVFALPHDVHPLMLAYRRDVVEALGIDVTKLTTWDEFCRVGREISKDNDRDGNPDRYMLDLPAEGGDALRFLLQQKGGGLLSESGDVGYDNELAAELVEWYVRQTTGPDRISFPAGWGQNLAKAMNDGLVLFYFCPDWRVRQFMNDVPGLSGKMGLIPLPAWKDGGPRTSSWGGTGLAITKACKNPDLAWQLAMELYYDAEQLGPRYAATNILPPLKAAWTLPQFDEPSDYFGGLKVGRAYAELAGQTPEETSSAFTKLATDKFSEAYGNSVLWYREHPGDDKGFRKFVRQELHRVAERVRASIQRNVFQGDASASAQSMPIANDSGWHRLVFQPVSSLALGAQVGVPTCATRTEAEAAR